MTATAPGSLHDLRFQPADPEAARTLTAVQVERFNREGYVAPLDAFDPAATRANRAVLDRLHPAMLEAGLGDYDINGFHTTCPSVWDLVTTPRLLACVRDLIGPDIVCWGAHYFVKTPGDLRRVSWHQDGPYWPLFPAQTVTAWVAIDDVDAENGAMRVIPGSHRRGVIPFRASEPGERNVLWLTVDEAVAEAEPVTIALRAGQFSLHSDLLLHGSEPNPSTRRRCGIAIRYVAATSRRTEENFGFNETIVCGGNDGDGHWRHCPRPAGDDLANAHRRAAALRAARG